MSVYGEVPHHEQEYQLTYTETEQFLYEEVWPAVDFLAHFDFVNDAPIGTEFSHGLVLPRPYGTMVLLLNAQILADIDEDTGERTRYCEAQLSIEQTCPDMHEKTLQVADEDDADDERFVWEVRTFELSTDPENLVDGDLGIQIRDSNGEVIWEDDEMSGEAPYVEGGITEEEVDSFNGLMVANMIRSITNHDRDAIRSTLANLGVPEEYFKTRDPEEGIIFDPPTE